MNINDDAQRKAAEKAAAEYQAIVMSQLFGFLTLTGPTLSSSPTTNQTTTNEKETPDSRFN